MFLFNRDFMKFHSSAMDSVQDTTEKEIIDWTKGTMKNVLYQDRTDGKLVPRLVLPHVVKNDIRLLYPSMVANVYNACDLSLTGNFLNRYYSYDFVAVSHVESKFPILCIVDKMCLQKRNPFHRCNDSLWKS